MNYAQLTNKILEIAIKQDGINYAGYGNIYSFNSETVKDYPVFWLYSPNGITNYENYVTAQYYLVYMDRTTARADDDNGENLLIENSGHMILSNIINKIALIKDVDIESDGISFSIFEGVNEKSDNVHGVFCNITVSWPNDMKCVV